MSRAARSILLGVGVALAVSGCGGAAPPATPPAPGPVATPVRSTVVPKEPDAGPPLPPMSYSAKQRRDPFTPIPAAEGAKGLAVASAKLAGVVQGEKGRVGLVEAPDGIGYILKRGDVLGDGRVVEIGQDFISFSVASAPGQAAKTVTLRLRTD